MSFSSENRSVLLGAAGLLSIGVLFAFQNFTTVNAAASISPGNSPPSTPVPSHPAVPTASGATALAMIDVGDGISYPIPINTPALSINTLYNYLDYSPNIDTAVIRSIARSLGYLVVSTGPDNSPPWVMTILQGPQTNPTVLMDIWSDPVLTSTYPSNSSGYACTSYSMVPVDFMRSGFSAAISSSNNKVKIDVSKLDSKFAPSVALAVSAINSAMAGQGAPTFTTGDDTTAAKSIGVYCGSKELPTGTSGTVLAITNFYQPWIGTHPGGARITVNCDYIQNNDITEVIYHELGHVLGLGDNVTNKNSPMYYAQSMDSALKPFSNAELSLINHIYSKQNIPFNALFCHDLNLTLSATAPPNPLPTPTSTVSPCTARSCTGGFSFDPNSCSCECSISSCPEGYTFNSTYCECSAAGSPVGNCGTMSCDSSDSVLNLSTCQCDVIGNGGSVYTYPINNPTGQPCDGEDEEDCE